MREGLPERCQEQVPAQSPGMFGTLHTRRRHLDTRLTLPVVDWHPPHQRWVSPVPPTGETSFDFAVKDKSESFCMCCVFVCVTVRLSWDCHCLQLRLFMLNASKCPSMFKEQRICAKMCQSVSKCLETNGKEGARKEADKNNLWTMRALLCTFFLYLPLKLYHALP